MVKWLRANRISLNVDKTEIVIYKCKSNLIKKRLNFQLSGQKINLSINVKYLGITLQDDWNWNLYLSELTMKSSKAFGILAEIQYFVSKFILKNKLLSPCLIHTWYMDVKFGIIRK